MRFTANTASIRSRREWPLRHLGADMARRPTGSKRRAALTPREIEVLTLTARGQTARQIAEKLSITKRTVDAHVQRATFKLGAANKTNAIAIAFSEGIIGHDV